MQLDRVVIGVDLTNPSTRAAQWVARKFAADAEIVLLHCLNPMLVERRVPDARAAAERALAALSSEIGRKRSSFRIRVGDPARSLADLAAEVDADLIAVGSHEEHPDRLPTLGSTAERLVRCSPVPVLLCSAAPMGTPRSVLLPLDSVDVATELAEWTGELAQRFDAQLALVHVESTNEDDHLTSPRAPNRVFGMPTTPWTRVARERPAHRVFVDAVLGNQADVILFESKRFGSDLVLLQAPENSETPDRVDPVTRVLRRAECPVLVIPSVENTRLMPTR